MLNYLPKFLRTSKVYQEIFDSEGNQIVLLETDIEDVKKQLSVDTATWGLIIYEKEYGIKTDVSKPLEDRRSVIKSKMRGHGKVGSQLLKIVADAYTNGDVDVSFNGYIGIRFTSKFGVPPNLDDCKNALEEVRPAHLRIMYEFRYLTVDEVQLLTISEMESKTMDNFKPFAESFS